MENLKVVLITLAISLMLTGIGLVQYNIIGQTWSAGLTLMFAIASWFLTFIMGMTCLFESVVKFNLRKRS